MAPDGTIRGRLSGDGRGVATLRLLSAYGLPYELLGTARRGQLGRALELLQRHVGRSAAAHVAFRDLLRDRGQTEVRDHHAVSYTHLTLPTILLV